METVSGSSTNEFKGPAAFVPINPNPYIVGNPVRDRTMFFGREAEFKYVRERFQGSKRGGLLVFCGERRSGKTSILFQILDNRLGQEFIPVLIDMQSMAIGSEEDFLAKIAQEILDALGPEVQDLQPPKFDKGTNHAATFQRFIESVLRRYPDKKLILLFDEYELFENKIDQGVLAEDVLLILAGLMEKRPVYLVFTGSQHLEQRRREYWNILGKSLYKEISYLEREDAVHLIQKPVEGVVRYEPGAIETIYRLTAGQPFYTQAVCQNLVDQLNEKKTNDATRESVAAVADAIVNNPLPQMIFLWDSLERDEKLVMALLAESLADEKAFANAKQLSRTILQREYPLSLNRAAISTALEKLFKAHLLLKDDTQGSPVYAFRMDLWRLWIRRMHSVWQVMREEKLEIRRRFIPYRTRMRIYLASGSTAAAALIILFVYPGILKPQPRPRIGPVPDPVATGTINLQATPNDAAIYDEEGRKIALGLLTLPIPANVMTTYRITAQGYGDTTVGVSVAVGDTLTKNIALVPFRGTLRVTTEPAGADIVVDEVARGKSPLTLAGLDVPRKHTVKASLRGFGVRDTVLEVTAHDTTGINIALAARQASIVFTSDPPNAKRLVNGKSLAVVDVVVPFGKHNFSARLDGYSERDSAVQVDETVNSVHLVLTPERPGELVVMGDHIAREIRIDEVLVKEGTQNARQQVRPGPHTIRVVLNNNETVTDTVLVHSDERLQYDYSRKSETRQSLKGN